MASAIQKTFRCIEALSRSPAGLTVSELAAVAGFSRPAATRLLEGLTADSIIIRDPRSKRYRLGLRLYEWANAGVQASTPINIARKEFIKLSMETRRECNFLVLEELDAVILERSEDVDGVPLNRPVPGRLHWFLTASGKAIVAHMQADAAAAILARTAHLPNAPEMEALSAELEEIRARGWASSVGHRPEGMVSLAVPVLGQGGYAVAGIGTYMPQAELEAETGRTLIAQMRSTAARISHYLGYESRDAVIVS